MAHKIEQVSLGTGTADGKSLGELFSELTRESTDLVRAEVALAKTEMSHTAARVGKDIGFLVLGGAVVYAGFLALCATVILGLIQSGVTWWFAAFLVGLVVAGAGALLVWTGLQQLKRTSLVPTQTVQTLKEDAQWTKDQI